MKDKGKFLLDDTTHILNIDYLRDIPVDYKEQFTCPTSVLTLPTWKKYLDIIGYASATINSKQRFHRILVKMKDWVKPEDLLNDPYLRKKLGGRKNRKQLADANT